MKLLENIFLVFTVFGVAFATHAQANGEEESVVTITRIAIPWYAPEFLIKSKMKDSIPEYASIPGLKRKLYSIEKNTGRFGGIYLWENRKAAEAWFSPEWFSRVNKKYGGDNQVPILKTVYLFYGEKKEPVQVNDQIAQVKVYQTNFKNSKEISKYFETKIETLQKEKGFQSLWVTWNGASQIQVITLWKDQESSQNANLQGLSSDLWIESESILTKVPIVINNK